MRLSPQLPNFSIPDSRFSRGNNHVTLFQLYWLCKTLLQLFKTQHTWISEGIFIRRGSKREHTTESARERDPPWLSQCLPEDQRELWNLTSQPTSHICGSPQNTFHCCLSFWLPSMTLPPNPTPPLPLARWLFFLNSLCLAPPLSILGRSGRKGPAGDIGLCGQMVLRYSRANKMD